MSMNKPVGILIVDDHPVVLQGFRFLLQDVEEVEILACCTNAAESLSFLAANYADIVLLDINLPDKNGIELCAEIKKLSPSTRVIGISNNHERGIITRMLQSGASGYILKNASAEELLSCIHDALDGKLVLSQDVQSVLAQSHVKELAGVPRLTHREKEILKLIAAGLTTAEMADQLCISPLTVETHRRNLMQKFEVNNAPALIRMAGEHKLI